MLNGPSAKQKMKLRLKKNQRWSKMFSIKFLLVFLFIVLNSLKNMDKKCRFKYNLISQKSQLSSLNFSTRLRFSRTFPAHFNNHLKNVIAIHWCTEKEMIKITTETFIIISTSV